MLSAPVLLGLFPLTTVSSGFIPPLFGLAEQTLLGTPSLTPEQGSQAARLCLHSHECSSMLQDNFLFRYLLSR